ncbi:MAG: hypothetical protein WCJ70_03595 [bacterium]
MTTETTVRNENPITSPIPDDKPESSQERQVTPVQLAIDHINISYLAFCATCGKEPSSTIQLSSIESDYKALFVKHPDLSIAQYIEYLSESKSWHAEPNFHELPINANKEDKQNAFDANQDMKLMYNLESLLTYSERKGKFIEAINAYNPKTIDFAHTDGDKIRILEEIMGTGLLLVGETHGVVQNCDVIYTLSKSLGIRRLAIEFPQNYQSSIEKPYLRLKLPPLSNKSHMTSCNDTT